MREQHTWRTLLGTLIEETVQRQTIATELGVNPLTLTRWVEKKSNPRPESLRRLLSVFPEHQMLLKRLITQEFPEFPFEASKGDEGPEEIPSAFYHQVLSMLSSLPYEQVVWSACKLILQHAFEHLDPRHQSVAVLITQCVPPSGRNNVRSLHSTMRSGIVPWGREMESQGIFLGADTVPGQVVSSGLPVSVQNYQDPLQGEPENSAGIVSSCTYPLLRTGQLAGTFGAVSSLPEYFPPFRQRLIQHYATLLSSVLASDMFYPPQNLALHVMPSPVVQLPYLKTLRNRILQIMTEARSGMQSITLAQAEQRAWQQLEEELLQVAGSIE